jgi:hypothetical protein
MELGLVLSVTWAWERKLLNSKLMYFSIPAWLAFAVAGKFIMLEGMLFLALWVAITVFFGYMLTVWVQHVTSSLSGTF